MDPSDSSKLFCLEIWEGGRREYGLRRLFLCPVCLGWALCLHSGLGKGEEGSRGTDFTGCALGSLTRAMVTPLSGLTEPGPVWGQEVRVIPPVSQTLASGFQMSSRYNRHTNRQAGRALIVTVVITIIMPMINIAKHLLFFIQPCTVDE